MPSRRVDPKAIAPDSVLAAVLAERAIASRATITIEHDGERVEGREGEPLAISLLARGRLALARSVKFHRPRGAACLRGLCEGCLTRVDGVPNVMACCVPAREGVQVHSQNAFPNASIDVLRVTDWFFPREFDHHHLMVRYGRTINAAMTVFARRMAGLGTLPDVEGPLPTPEARVCDVLVVGAGPAGLAAAAELARGGAHVLLIDEEPEPGGTLLDELERLPGPSEASKGPTGRAFAAALTAEARRAGAEVLTHASAAATFDNATVVVSPERAMLVRARARVFATGCHEQLGAFENNDLPGVFTARAAARALGQGVLVGERVLIVGEAWPAQGLAQALRDAGAHVDWLPGARLLRARGTGAVSGARLSEAGAERTFKCDALVVAAEPTPAYEILGQAGVAARPEAARMCFAPDTRPDGSTERPDVFAAGSVREPMGRFEHVDPRRPLEAGGAVADGVRVARAVLSFLRADVTRAEGAL